MEIAAFWIIASIAVGVVAGSRGRNGFGWFLLSCLLSPLIAGFLVVAMPSLKPATGQLSGEPNYRKAGPARIGAPSRVCPYCESAMSATAPVCATCGRESQPTMTREAAAAAVLKEKSRHDRDVLIKVGLVVAAALILIARCQGGGYYP
jgi:hypothetical protein